MKTSEDDLGLSDADAVVKQLRRMATNEKKPQVRKTAFRSKKSAELAAMMVHSLRSDLRGMAGLEAPEEFVFEQPRQKIRLVPAVKVAPPMPEPAGPQGPEPFESKKRTETAMMKKEQPKLIDEAAGRSKKAKPEIKKGKKKLSGKQRLLRILARRLRK